ncbi:MAG: hypothetical protein K9L87_04650 [Candidatus Omnitrophica bacterium]|nr:hypothetical protein [Candidatus Omnitrophota bacterium]MCF7892525.1 hypothetical protein [Candidatus Omnitrophota bacterium]MCF7895680.1 hypothetical protein [Candidatus Omnitrophota bacterium]MCF7898020.1 hypothetical protein [Candidatus Omnitrophota bacterium]
MKVFFIILFSITYFYLAVTSVSYIYFRVHKARDLDNKPLFKKRILNNYFFFIGALISLIALLVIGLEEALIFIPESWGRYGEDGDWESLRLFWASVIAFLLAGGIMKIVEEYIKYKIKNKKDKNKEHSISN